MSESLGEPHCWVIPGRDTANDYGFMDASCCENGEMSRPLWPIENIRAALAEARAEGRRQGLEEAAKEADEEVKATFAASGSVKSLSAVRVYMRIRKLLATDPAETQKPETGESR